MKMGCRQQQGGGYDARNGLGRKAALADQPVAMEGAVYDDRRVVALRNRVLSMPVGEMRVEHVVLSG